MKKLTFLLVALCCQLIFVFTYPPQYEITGVLSNGNLTLKGVSVLVDGPTP